jgi:hypothetical protein
MSGNAVELAINLLSYIGPAFEAPEIAPLPSGGLELSWEGMDFDTSIEVKPRKDISLFIGSRRGDVEIDVVGLSLSNLVEEHLARLLSRLPMAAQSAIR